MTKSQILSPSSVRKIILAEHSQLRDKLSQVEAMYETKDPVQFKESVQELVYLFVRHIEHEEEILKPLLSGIDAWGDVRSERIEREHQSQRREIDKIQSALVGASRSELVSVTQKFAELLKADMEHEEKDCLHPELLKDDPVTIGNYTR